MKRRSAFTLAELLVYIGVLSVFTTALYAVVNLSIRHMRISEARGDTSQHNLQAMMRVNQVLKGGANGTLQVQANPPALMLLSAAPPSGTNYEVDGSGQLLWQQWVCVRFDAASQRILCSQLVITPTPTIPTAPSFVTMAALPPRVLGRQITALEFTLVDARTVSYSVTSSVTPSISTRHVGNNARISSTTVGLLSMRN